jgi:hypothetical protein
MSEGANAKTINETDKLARQFHERYEELAPLYGYTTRNDTRVFDPESPNGQLMRAVCLQVVGPIIAERDEARIQYRSTEALGMALVKTIGEMKAERVDFKATIESLRDQLCADKCRDKAAADGGWGNI